MDFLKRFEETRKKARFFKDPKKAFRLYRELVALESDPEFSKLPDELRSEHSWMLLRTNDAMENFKAQNKIKSYWDVTFEGSLKVQDALKTRAYDELVLVEKFDEEGRGTVLLINIIR